MRSPVRMIFLAPVVMAAAAVAMSSAQAETVSVPFSFTVHGRNCPAGEYSVERGRVGDSVVLKSADRTRSFTMILGPGDPEPAEQRVVLTFDAIGETHALRTVQYGNEITERMDPKPRKGEYVPTRVMSGE